MELINWSLQHSATSLDPNEHGGSIPQFTVNVVEPSGFRMGEEVDFGGSLVGVARREDVSYGFSTITADNPLTKFNSWHTVPPVSLPLEYHLIQLSSLVGFTPALTTDVNLVVTTAGFVGNVWDYLKELLSAHSLELAKVGGVYTVTTPRQTTVPNQERVTALGHSISAQQSAPQVEVYYYPKEYGAQIEVYPGPDDNPIVADAGETVVQEVRIQGGLAAVNQPEAVYQLPALDSFDGTNGYFVVCNNESLPLQPDEFYGLGGELRVDLTDDPSVLTVTFTAPAEPHGGPYSLLESDDYERYNSLHITGTGTRLTEEKITLHTGAPPSTNGEVIGATVQNHHIGTLAQAFTAGQYTAGNWSGLSYGVTASGWPGDEVPVGGRFKYRDNLFRVEQVDSSPDSTSISATMDVTMEDFSSKYTGLTMGQFVVPGVTTMYDLSVSMLKGVVV